MKKAIPFIYYPILFVMGASVLAGLINVFFAVTIAAGAAIWIYITDPRKRKYAVLALMGLMAVSSVVIRWPIGYILPMTGYLLDKKTGEPIENAILEVEWFHGYVSAAGGFGRSFDKSYIVSGKDGRYRISGRLTIPIPLGSYGVKQTVLVRHPLYESKRLSGAESPVVISNFDAWNSNAYISKMHPMRIRLGRISRDLRLSKLADKYRAARNVGGVDITWAIHDEMVPYAMQAKRMELDIDWEKTFEEWDAILQPFGGDKGAAKSEILKIVSGGANEI